MKKLFSWFCKAIFAIIILITQQQKALSQCFSHIDVTPTTTGTANATGVSDTDFTTFGTILGNATAGTNRLNFNLGYTLPENLTIALYFSNTGTSNINAGIMCYSGGGALLYTGTSVVAPGSTTTGASYNHTLPAGTRTFRVYNTSPATTLRLHTITYPKTPIASAIAQSFCSSATTTIANLLPTPSSIYRWYDVPTGGTALLSTATITASDTFYVSEVNLFGCEGPRTLVPVTIGLPVVNTIDNQTLCNGTSTTAVNFSGTASYYSWTNNNTSIGLAANGIGNIPAFTATNIGGTAVTATITANPINAPMAYVANSVSNNVSVINTATNTLIATVPVGTAPRGVSTSPDGSRVYVTNSGSNNVSVINTATNTVTATIVVGTNPMEVSVSPDGSKVYVTNSGSNNVSVINTATNTVTATIAVGTNPMGVSVSPDGSKVYVANNSSNNVSVINTATNTVTETVAVGTGPRDICVKSDGKKVYVANYTSNNISVINTATNTVSAPVTVGTGPTGVSVSPDGSKVYVANYTSNNVSILNTATNTVTTTVAVGTGPFGTAITPDGSKVYVANYTSNNVSILNTATNTVTTTVAVGTGPYSLGNFIINTPNCASTPNCAGTPQNFTITVNPTPTAPTAAAQSFCDSTTVAALVPATSTTIKWYTASTGGSALVSTDVITTSGTYYVAARSVNGCESNRTSVSISINATTLASSNLSQTLNVINTTLFNNNCGDVIAKINPTGTSPISGSTDAKVWIEGTQPSNYVKRHYEITPATASATATGTITLYFTQAEFDDFNAVNAVKLPAGSADASGIANLLIEKRSGVSSDGTGLPNTYTASIITINPADADIIWNVALSRWEISFDVTGFSGFFVKTQVSTLPLRLTSFTASKLPNTNVQLQWQANNEVNVNRYEVESSSTSSNFIKIGNVSATNLSNYQLIDSRDWNSEVRFYRLKMIDNDGSFKYSTVVRVSSSQVGSGINIYPNPVNDVFTIQITDKNLLHTTAQLTDVSGKLIRLIPINNSYQNESVVGLPSGLYILKFTDGSFRKVVKQ